MPEIKITREQITVVDKVDKNSYGDLVFTDKEGVKYKIGNKRIQYFEKAILPDTTIKLSFATSSFGKEYIYRADKVSDELAKQAHQSSLVKEAVKLGAEVIGATDDPKLRSICVAYAKDLAVADKIELKDISKYADKFLGYILNIKRKEG